MKWLKANKLISVSIVIALLFITLYNTPFVREYSQKLMGEKLVAFAMGSDSRIASITYQQVRFSIISSQLTFDEIEVSFHPPENDTTINSFTAQRINLNIDGLWKIYFRKSLEIEGLSISNPQIVIHKKVNNSESTNLSLQAGDLYHSISNILQTLAISKFELTNGHFQINIHGEDGMSPITINNLSMWIDNFELDNKSQDRTDKILFTDNIKIKFINQSVYLPDSIHMIHFDSLSLSTEEDYFVIYGFDVQAKKDETNKANYYDLHIPILDIKNVDFSKAYNQRMLEIDQVLMQGGIISIDNEKTTIENRSPDLLLQLNQIFGTLAIKELSFKDTQLSINAYPIGFPQKFNLSQLDLSIYEILLDHTNTSFDISNRYFKDLELTLKKHTISIAERNHQLEIEGIHISTKRSLFSADKVHLEPILRDNTVSTLNDAHIENITLEGFDPYTFITDRELLLKLIHISSLQLKVTPKSGLTISQPNTLPDFENLFPYIKPYVNKLQIDSLSIQNISLDFTTANGPILLEGASLLVDVFDLDSASYLIKENLLHARNFILFVPFAKVPIENQLVTIDSLYLNKTESIISTKTIRINNESIRSNAIITGQVDQLYLKGVKLRDIIYHQQYQFDTVLVNSPHIRIQNSGTLDKKKTTVEISKYISAFEIDMLSISDGEVDYSEGNLDIAHLKNLNAQLLKAQLSEADLKQNNILVKYDDFFLNFDSLQYSTPEFKHLLRVQSFQLHLKDSTGAIQNISLIPVVESDSAALFTVSIPSIAFKGINDYNSYFNKKIDVSTLQIQRPSISVQAGLSPISPTEKNGLPILKSNMFLLGWDSLGVKNFQIQNGTFTFHKNNETLHIQDFDLAIHDFNAQENVDMVPERFLFSNELDVDLTSIRFTNSEKHDSILISHAQLNSKTKKLQLNGVHFSIGKTNPAIGNIPSISLSDFSPYHFTQEKNIIIETLTIERPELRISLPEKPADRKIKKFAQLNTYPFNTNQIASVRVTQSNVNNAKILGFNDSLLSVGDIGFSLTNFVLHPDSIAKRNLPFHSEKFDLSVSNLNYQINTMNKIHVGVLDYSSKPSTVTVQSFSLIPLYDQYEYGEKVGNQVSWLALKNSKTKINNLNFEELIGNKSIHATSIIVDDVSIDIFRDKQLPFPTGQVRELPQRGLLELPFEVRIDSLHLKKGRIEYVEQSAKVDANGSIFFDNMRADITNITNDSLRILKNPMLVVKVETQLYGTAATIARFDFNLADPDFGYTYSTSVGALDLIELNKILEPAALTKVKEGKLNSLQQTVTANDHYAQGEMIFKYEDLKVQLIKELDDPNPGLGKSLASFFANTFIVRSKNTAPFVRKSDVFFERNHAKSIFDFLVKSTLSGVVESIGARSNRKKIKQHKKDAKQLAKKKNKALPID